MNKFIPYGKPFVSESEIEEVSAVLRSNWLTTGPKVQQFETEFSRFVDSRYAIAVSSGTAALELALACLNFKEGEVITTPFSFAATANCILYNDLTPIFADIEPETLNISPKEIRKKISDKTKAIICMDYAGYPCKIDEIKKIADEHDLVLIQDAAHSLGAEYNGNKVGGLADLTTFSFHPVKNMTTGEGGMITTNNPKLYQKLLMLRNHGLDKDDKRFGGDWSYNLKYLGRNYRLTDFQSVLGIEQLRKLDLRNIRRRKIATRYYSAFDNIAEIDTLNAGTAKYAQEYQHIKHAQHIFPILLRKVERNQFFNELKARNLGVNVHYIPIYRFDYYDQFNINPENFPVTENTFKRIITLPLYPEMTDEDVDYVISSVQNTLNLFRNKQ